MVPIDIFGWLLCVLLSISFIASIIFMPKSASVKEKFENNPPQQTFAKKEIKKEFKRI